MPPRPRPRPTLRAQWLGHLLRDLREANGMTLKEAADYLQRDLSTVSRFETGIYPVRRGDVMALIDLYGVEDTPQREALMQLATDVWQKGWWESYAGHVSGWVIDYVWLESRAREITAFVVTHVQALLQTPEYAEALIRAADPDAGDEQVARWLRLRTERQRVVYDKAPVHLSVILDEAALRRPVGGRAVMCKQLHHLVECAARPNIDIRILPFSAGEHASMGGGFRLIRMADPFPEVGYVEGPAGALYLESSDAERLNKLYDLIQAKAFGPEQSASFLATVAEELH